MSETFNRQQVDAITAPWLCLCKEQEEHIAKLTEALQEIADSTHLGNSWARHKAKEALRQENADAQSD